MPFPGRKPSYTPTKLRLIKGAFVGRLRRAIPGTPRSWPRAVHVRHILAEPELPQVPQTSQAAERGLQSRVLLPQARCRHCLRVSSLPCSSVCYCGITSCVYSMCSLSSNSNPCMSEWHFQQCIVSFINPHHVIALTRCCFCCCCEVAICLGILRSTSFAVATVVYLSSANPNDQRPVAPSSLLMPSRVVRLLFAFFVNVFFAGARCACLSFVSFLPFALRAAHGLGRKRSRGVRKGR